MHQKDELLDRLLVFYRFDNKKKPQSTVLSIQLSEGYKDFAQISLCQEQQYPFGTLMYHRYNHDQKVFSLCFKEGDILYMRAINNEIIISGGVWQVQWWNRPEQQGYHLVEIISTGFDVIEVDHFMQEEASLLFEEAIAYAQAFVEATYDVPSVALLNGREVGASAPERILSLSSPVEDWLATPHTWLMALTGWKKSSTVQIYVLVEIEYAFKDGKWQYGCKVLKEYPENRR